MLTKKQQTLLKKEITESKNPLYFYDDDPDGLCSFLVLYRMHREGKGIIVKSAPILDQKFVRKIDENSPDKIFVLDVPMVSEEFIEASAKTKTFWIDHHEPQEPKHINYFNPRIKDPDAYIPTTRMAYQISQNKNDLWLATTGCLSDWHMPDFIDQFIEMYPNLLPEKKDLNDAVFKQPIGKLVKVFSFLLKGPTSEVRKSVKILTRINSPYEILNQETSQGRYIYKRFQHINKKYEELINQAKKRATRSKLLIFYYGANRWSFTADLANELVNMYPKKVIIIARNKSGEMKCSLRAKTNIRDALEKALLDVEGYGGGHEKACGTVVKEKDWEKFLKTFKEEIK